MDVAVYDNIILLLLQFKNIICVYIPHQVTLLKLCNYSYHFSDNYCGLWIECITNE